MRLSQDTRRSVAVLEAGGKDNHLLINMPAGLLAMRKRRPFNWHYKSQPIPHCNDRSIDWPRGKVLGGSSSINGMMYVRGHKADYDRWAASGLVGWDYEACLPYFKKAEDNATKLNDPYHSQSGPLGVCDAAGGTPLFQAFLDAARQAELPETSDFNGAQQEGVGHFQFNINDGERCSTARAYLHPASTRDNLAVSIFSQATRVIFENTRAVGVEYSQFGQRKCIWANKEVILSGGTINSPQLLKLSGVGPATELRQHGIEVVTALDGVGENLQDHFDYLMEYESLTNETFDIYNRSLTRRVLAGLSFITHREGPATSVPLDVGGFVRTSPSVELPDIELQMFGARIDDDDPAPGFKIHVTIMRPESRGRVMLASNDAFSSPLIFPNFLSTQTDRDTIRAGVTLARNIVSQSAFDPYRGREIRPGENVLSNAELDAEIAANGEMDHHCVGTCAMGIGRDAVVDAACRVHGIDALRVVDASVMPTIIGGNTNAPTIMIAEKIADAILDSPL